MKALPATVALLALLQTGCQDAVTAPPIDPPQVAIPQFQHADVVEKRLKSWSRLDDSKRQQVLVNDASQATANIFADPQTWPDCKKLFGQADKMLTSGTIYGIMQVPAYHQRAIGMGCKLEQEGLQQRYQHAFAAAFKGYKVEFPATDIDQASAYLTFRSMQGMETCAYHSMRQSRENGRPFSGAIAAIHADCERPAH